jgi:hypothetical protein
MQLAHRLIKYVFQSFSIFHGRAGREGMFGPLSRRSRNWSNILIHVKALMEEFGSTDRILSSFSVSCYILGFALGPLM